MIKSPGVFQRIAEARKDRRSVEEFGNLVEALGSLPVKNVSRPSRFVMNLLATHSRHYPDYGTSKAENTYEDNDEPLVETETPVVEDMFVARQRLADASQLGRSRKTREQRRSQAS